MAAVSFSHALISTSLKPILGGSVVKELSVVAEGLSELFSFGGRVLICSDRSQRSDVCVEWVLLASVGRRDVAEV